MKINYLTAHACPKVREEVNIVTSASERWAGMNLNYQLAVIYWPARKDVEPSTGANGAFHNFMNDESKKKLKYSIAQSALYDYDGCPRKQEATKRLSMFTLYPCPHAKHAKFQKGSKPPNCMYFIDAELFAWLLNHQRWRLVRKAFRQSIVLTFSFCAPRCAHCRVRDDYCNLLYCASMRNRSGRH